MTIVRIWMTATRMSAKVHLDFERTLYVCECLKQHTDGLLGILCTWDASELGIRVLSSMWQ